MEKDKVKILSAEGRAELLRIILIFFLYGLVAYTIMSIQEWWYINIGIYE